MQDNVSSRIRAAVESAGLNLKEAAKVCDIPYRTLQDYISGKADPGAGNLIKLSTGLRISSDRLLLGEEQTLYAIEVFGEAPVAGDEPVYMTTAGLKKRSELVEVLDIPDDRFDDWLKEKGVGRVGQMPGALDTAFLGEVITGVEEFLEEEGKILAPADKAELITTLFAEAHKMEEEGVEAKSRAFRLSRLISRFVGSH